MRKTTTTITIDYDVAINMTELIKQRKLSTIINGFLREYLDLNKKDSDDKEQTPLDLEKELEETLARAEELRLKKEQLEKEQEEEAKKPKTIWFDLKRTK